MLLSFLAGAPLPPHLMFNGSASQVYWDEPFTVERFPIIGYIVTVITHQENEEVETVNLLSAETLSFTITLQLDPSSCANLTISVVARNDVGNSTPGIIDECSFSKFFLLALK